MNVHLDNTISEDAAEIVKNNLQRGQQVIQSYLATLPQKSGVYRMRNAQDKVLYVGKAKNLRKRVQSYTLVDKLPNRLQRMVSDTYTLEIVVTNSEAEALLLESNLIKKLQPTYNILLKDDKSFSYIVLTHDHDFAKITKYRGPQKNIGKYFGPFASSQAVEEAILSVQRVFQIRNCSDSYFANRTRPCLQYYIKRCSAPCVGKISKEEYQNSVDNAKDFLNGKGAVVQKVLAEKMQQASDEMRFEHAAVYRDKIKLLTQIQSKQVINLASINDADIVALAKIGQQSCAQIFFFRNGCNLGTQSFDFLHEQENSYEEQMSIFLNQFYCDRTPAPLILLSHEPNDFNLIKQSFAIKYQTPINWEIPKRGVKKELILHALSNADHHLQQKINKAASFKKIFTQIQNIFALLKPITRIEVYDNSHISGTNAYGVMIAVNQDGFDRKSYRKFAVDSNGNDLAMMQEVIYRRTQHLEWELPDLFLIDGGQNQINVVNNVLQQSNIDIPVIGIAKGPNRNAGQEKFFYQNNPPFSFNEDHLLLYFLQNIRDEAHRFAITTHRHGRMKNIAKSALDQIPGIGASRKKALLRYFGSAKMIARASVKDLQMVEGISNNLANEIFAFFNDRKAS